MKMTKSMKLMTCVQKINTYQDFEWITIFLIIALFVIVSKSQQDKKEVNMIRIEWLERKNFCGRFLSDLLSEVCEGNYPELLNENRRRRRRATGVSNECCEHACTAQYLRYMYCAGGPSTDSRPYLLVPQKSTVTPVVQYIQAKSGRYEWGV